MFDIKTRRDASRRSEEAEVGYGSDADLGPETALSGIVAGTRVATAVGWRNVEDLEAGDAVLTFDSGLKTVQNIKRKALWDGNGACPSRFQPLHVPRGAIGNREEMLLLPRQGVLVESDIAEEELGDPFVLIRAEALDGVCGIARRRPIFAPEVFVLEFEEDQVIFASSGALCVCPAAGDMFSRLFSRSQEATSDYTILSQETSRELIEKITWELEEKWAFALARSGQAEGAAARHVSRKCARPAKPGRDHRHVRVAGAGACATTSGRGLPIGIRKGSSRHLRRWPLANGGARHLPVRPAHRGPHGPHEPRPVC